MIPIQQFNSSSNPSEGCVQLGCQSWRPFQSPESSHFVTYSCGNLLCMLPNLNNFFMNLPKLFLHTGMPLLARRSYWSQYSLHEFPYNCTVPPRVTFKVFATPIEKSPCDCCFKSLPWSSRDASAGLKNFLSWPDLMMHVGEGLRDS